MISDDGDDEIIHFPFLLKPLDSPPIPFRFITHTLLSFPSVFFCFCLTLSFDLLLLGALPLCTPLSLFPSQTDTER